MRYNRKKKLSLTLLLMLILLLSELAYAQESDLIYHEKKVQPIAPGVSYEMNWQFTPAGWLRFHLIRADLTQSDVESDLLLGEKGLAGTERLSTMAAKAAAVAAINGDFFFGQGTGAPLGPVVKEGELLSSPSQRQDLAMFALGKDGSVTIDRPKFLGQVESEDGTRFPLAAWNKPGDTYRELYGFDSYWGKTTPAKVPTDSIAAIISDATVIKLVPAETSITIGPTEQVLIGAQAARQFLQQHLTPGSRVKIDFTSTVTWPKFAWAIGGGTILIKDGRIVPFSHEVAGNNPRSAVGISADGSQLILAAVDGRQEESRGLTQTEWAATLLKLGCYQALNLDGGGSTTLLARLPGESSAAIVNKPSDGKERSVSNGIGIFSRAPLGELAGLTVTADETRIAPGATALLTVKGYDVHYNPIQVETDKINWRVEPAELGLIQGNVFIAQTSGRGKIIATCGPVEAELAIEVIGPVVRLELSPNQIALAPGQEAVFKAVAYDAVGRRAAIKAEELTWAVLGDIGTVETGRIKAGPEAAAGAVEARWGEIATRTLVTVGTYDLPLLYFEAMHGISAIAYPAEVGANISLAARPKPVYDGNYSLELAYDFTAGSGTKAAYVVFDQGLALPGQADKLSLMVHGDGRGHWLRALLVDKNGTEFTLDLARQVDWNGWQQVEARLPKGEYPYVLKRIYLVEPDADKHGSGAIYLDNLFLTSSMPFATEMKLDPRPFPDRQYTPVPVDSGKKFLVVASLPPKPDQVVWATALKAAIQKHQVEYLVCLQPLAETSQHDWEQILGLPLKLTGTAERWDEQTASLYTLNASGGTLVQGNAKDWNWLQADLLQLEGKKHVFVFLERLPFAGTEGFTSRPEADLLRRRLQETGQRLDALVWVFSPSQTSGIAWEDGVRYQRLQTAGPSEKPRLALISLKEGTATYTGLSY
ncbi:MAG: phosphodiester glycosidase family protein [Firmicutes bacterium]|nr:phosphodiester glycosidase family protein [Bacillota bacterium]